jgi:branched-chain amino acid transport system permease protein
MNILLGVLLNGLASAMILYIIAIGMSLTMGMMRFVNLAHGSFAMAGGYGLVWFGQMQGLPFWLAICISVVIVTAGAWVLERTLYRRLYGASELEQVLFTIGLIFVAAAGAHYLFGPSPQNVTVPVSLRHQISLGTFTASSYRTMLIIAGFLLFGGISLAMDKTSLGARLRAAVDNRRMAETIGIRTDLLFTLTFCLGSALAALGGALGAEVLPIRPSYAFDQLNYVLIVVAVGGLGTLYGPFIAALMLGIADTACKYWLPELGAFFIFAAMVVLLLWRPNGVFSRV